MSLETGRIAIETYWKANWTATPTGYSGHPFKPVAGSVRLNINNGATLQGSIGRVQNSIYTVGLLTVSIFTDGQLGDAAWTGYAQSVLDLFHGKALDASGAVVTSGAQVPLIRFSPPELGNNAHPYIGPVTKDAPFNMTNVICPFVRYELI